MRFKKLLWTIALVLSFGLVGLLPAAATDLHRTSPPAGWGQERVVNHYVYHPRYHHVYRIHGATDPYAYRPAHRGYYPYYNSGYWRPAHEMRHRHRPHYVLPKYQPGWGRNNHHGYNHNPAGPHHAHHWPWHW
jgi:hypothetical protein